MNLLSISCTNGVHSHLIPLFVLNQRYFRRMPDINNCFLLPSNLHDQYKRAGANVLPVDLSTFDGGELDKVIHGNNNQLFEVYYREYLAKIDLASKISDAEVIIDDNEVLSTLMAEKRGLPRISIFRTGLFRSIEV